MKYNTFIIICKSFLIVRILGLYKKYNKNVEKILDKSFSAVYNKITETNKCSVEVTYELRYVFHNGI